MKSLIVSLFLALFTTATAVTAAPNTSGVEFVVPSAPTVTSKSHILLDHVSGKVLSEGDADLRTEPASIAKIMSAYVAFHALKDGRVKLDDQVTISKKAWKMGGSQTFIEVGKQVRFEDLLHGMIVQSGNDASVAVAEHVAGSEESFADLMNAYAQHLGMPNSHFTSASGLTKNEEYTTARDIATLSSALIREFPEYYKIFGETSFEFNGIKQPNRNKLLYQNNGADGLKTGFTVNAGYCLAASAKQNETRMIAVVMGAQKPQIRNREATSLLTYGMRFYETHKLYGAGDIINQPRVWKGESTQVPLTVQQDLLVTIPKGRYDALRASMNVEPSITAPVQEGQVLGSVRVTFDNQEVGRAPLVTVEAIEEGGFFQRAWDSALLLLE